MVFPDRKHLQLKNPQTDKLQACYMRVFDYVKIMCGGFYFKKNRSKVRSISHEDFTSNEFNWNFPMNLIESNTELSVLLFTYSATCTLLISYNQSYLFLL